jgi:hypothetical protein
MFEYMWKTAFYTSCSDKALRKPYAVCLKKNKNVDIQFSVHDAFLE